MKKSILLLVFFGLFVIIHSQDNAGISIENNAMVKIPSGEFYMGAEDQQEFEKPRHKVILDGFYMDATEVTQQEFKSLMGRNPAFHNDNLQKPVEMVTWFDAVLFCNARSERDGLEAAYTYTWIEMDREVEGRTRMLHDLKFDPSKSGYRLPTEAQW